MEEKNNIPPLRFIDFAETWQSIKLKDVSTYSNGGSFEQYVKALGKYELITLKSVDVKGNLVCSEKFIDFETETLDKDTLIMILSEQSPGLLGVTARIPEDNKFVLNQRVAEIKPNDEIDSFFLSMVINRNQRYFGERGAGTKVQNISKPNVENFPFFIPKLKEQIKVSKLFQNLDNSIKNHNTQLKKLINLKKAMLIKMFPQDGASVPEIRFKGFDEEWNESSLDEEILFFTGLTYSPSDVNSKANTLVLRSSNVKNDEIIDADNVYVDESVINCSYVEKGDIIVVVRNGSRRLIGKHAQVKNDMPNTVIGAFMTGVRAEVPSFLNALLSTQLFQKQIEENLGATINQITTGVFKKMMFKFPKTNEQEQIGSYFQNLDTLIFNHKEQLKKLNQIKKACLSKLFVSQD